MFTEMQQMGEVKIIVNSVSQRKAHMPELAATLSTSFCGLAKSCDSCQWHEMSDRKVNILLSSKVTSALKMSWLRGLAPAMIYLDMKSLLAWIP